MTFREHLLLLHPQPAKKKMIVSINWGLIVIFSSSACPFVFVAIWQFVLMRIVIHVAIHMASFHGGQHVMHWDHKRCCFLWLLLTNTPTQYFTWWTWGREREKERESQTQKLKRINEIEMDMMLHRGTFFYKECEAKSPLHKVVNCSKCSKQDCSGNGCPHNKTKEAHKLHY